MLAWSGSLEDQRAGGQTEPLGAATARFDHISGHLFRLMLPMFAPNLIGRQLRKDNQSAQVLQLQPAQSSRPSSSYKSSCARQQNKSADQWPRPNGFHFHFRCRPTAESIWRPSAGSLCSPLRSSWPDSEPRSMVATATATDDHDHDDYDREAGRRPQALSNLIVRRDWIWGTKSSPAVEGHLFVCPDARAIKLCLSRLARPPFRNVIQFVVEPLLIDKQKPLSGNALKQVPPPPDRTPAPAAGQVPATRHDSYPPEGPTGRGSGEATLGGRSFIYHTINFRSRPVRADCLSGEPIESIAQVKSVAPFCLLFSLLPKVSPNRCLTTRQQKTRVPARD